MRFSFGADDASLGIGPLVCLTCLTRPTCPT